MRRSFHLAGILLGIVLSLTGCGSYFSQPFSVQEARLGEQTSVTKKLQKAPQPVEPIVVGVYKFRDQTGQYKPTENGSTFSTAVTQGATTILIKALEDSKWFVPIERENLSNLLNERNIIRSTRKEYRKTKNPNEPQLPPLLYAGIILEGGIVSYDSNIVTGGLGARYFGIGGATQYRQDRITVYLRAVSTSSGKILKTVYVSKTILSQSLSANFFRYVNFKRLLEAETGYTRNEPAQLAVTEAIEKAVNSLIVEGVEDKLWKAKGDTAAIDTWVAEYHAEKETAANTRLYDRYFKERRGKAAITAKVGGALISGDYADAELTYTTELGGKWFLNPYLNMNLSVQKMDLSNGAAFVEGLNAVNLSTEVILLPFESFTPFLFGGAGMVSNDEFEKTLFKFQYGAGIEYLLSDTVGVQVDATHNLVMSDELDNVVQGKRDDQYFTFSVGVNWYFDRLFKKKEHKKKIKKETSVDNQKKK